MKIFRFMSKLEFIKLCNGEKLENNTRHYEKSNSSSKGFCFLNYDEYKPEYALHFLSGVANTEICVVLETNNNLNKTFGVYAKPLSIEEYKKMSLFELFDFSNINSMEVNELCTNRYNKRDFKILKYCEPYQPNIFNTGDFKWVEYHD